MAKKAEHKHLSPPKEVVHFFSHPSAEKMAELLKEPDALHWCELPDTPNTLDKIPAFSLDGQSDLCIRISTYTAYSTNLADLLSQTIAARAHTKKTTRVNIHTALHEALSNAIIHGNLRISTTFSDIDRFKRFYQAIEKRFTQSRYRETPIDITVKWLPHGIMLSVQDYGDGFDAKRILAERDALKTKPYGMGLKLIAACAQTVNYADKGRRIIMTFAK